MTAAPHKLFRSALDDKLINGLLPLKQHGVTIRIPFFANTFPIAFHYATLLDDNGASASTLNKRITFISWARGAEQMRGIRRLPLVYYSTEKKIGDLSNADIVRVTQFQPRWIFSEFNLKVWEQTIRVSKDKKTLEGSHGVSFSQILPSLAHFDFFDIFTEIPDQAEALFEHLLKGLQRHPKVTYIRPHEARSLLPIEEHMRSNTLRLFVYGAPLISYFRRKQQRYIRFKIEELDDAAPTFETVMVIKGGDKAARTEIGKAVTTYHQELYKTAKADLKCEHDPQNFRAVQYSYNRIARLLQYRSSFLNSRDYAECLDLHHKEPEKVHQT